MPGAGLSLDRSHREAFASRWAAAWNRRDVEAVLAHFRDDIVFTSPTALTVAGVATIRGKQALRDYWNEALAGIGTLHFTVDHVLWDPLRRELAIVYDSRIDGRQRRVSENLLFDEGGLVAAAEVFHGVTGIG